MARQDYTEVFSVSIIMNENEVVLSNDEIKQFYFIEDIFSFAMSGKLLMIDTRGLFEFGPLTGNETIRVFYNAGENQNEENEEREWLFKIYKVSQIEQLSVQNPSSEEVIEIFFTDSVFFHMYNKVYSKSWRNQRISDIVKDIAENMLLINEHPEGWKFWEPSNEKLDLFYMPYWYPITAINWLMKRATGNRSKESGYCFYNSPQGACFITLGDLLNQDLMSINPGFNDEYFFESENTNHFNKILQWSLSGLDMTSLKHLSGGTKLGINSNNKNFIKKQFNYKNQLKNNTILGEYSLFPDISNSDRSVENLGESTENMINNRYNNMWSKRYALQHCASFVLRGHENRHAGGLIKVNWPSIDEKNQIYQKHLDGIYLIKSINHILSGYKNPAYRQKIVCIKNGYDESDVETLEKGTKIRN